MMRRLLFALAAVTLILAAGSVAAIAAPTFKRGATLVEFFQFPDTVPDGTARRYADPAYPHGRSSLDLFDFDQMRKMGFDHIRLPLDIGPLLSERTNQWQQIIGDLRAVIAAIHRHRLGVVVTLFPPAPGRDVPMPQLDGLQGPHFQHYVAIVERIALELNAIKTGTIALEPMNEPQEECRAGNGPDWTEYQDVIVSRMRQVAADLPLFVTGGCWSHIEGIVLLDTPLLRDPRNFVSVHFYLPFLFTHQTATWAMPYMAGVVGVPYPATEGSAQAALSATLARFATMTLPPQQLQAQAIEAERAIRNYFNEPEDQSMIEQWMNRLADWQAHEQVPSDHIVFTEFGAIKQIAGGAELDLPSRARWLHDASSAFERHGWGWTTFGYRDGLFALYDSDYDRAPDPRLLGALGLSPVIH